jgi:hypothetical protein
MHVARCVTQKVNSYLELRYAGFKSQLRGVAKKPVSQRAVESPLAWWVSGRAM